MLKLLAVAALIYLPALATGCSKRDGLSSCSHAVGACAEAKDAQCGIEFTCKDTRLELKCTPPTAGVKALDCQCIDNGVIGKTVKVEWPWTADSIEAFASSACGWPR